MDSWNFLKKLESFTIDLKRNGEEIGFNRWAKGGMGFGNQSRIGLPNPISPFAKRNGEEIDLNRWAEGGMGFGNQSRIGLPNPISPFIWKEMGKKLI